MERLLARALTSVAAAAVALILTASAVVCLCAALYLWLVSLAAAPPLAASLTGGVALALAALIIVVAHQTRRPGRASRDIAAPDTTPRAAEDIDQLAMSLGDLAARHLTSQARAHPYCAFGISLLAGLAVGSSPEIRDLLKHALKTR